MFWLLIQQLIKITSLVWAVITAMQNWRSNETVTLNNERPLQTPTSVPDSVDKYRQFVLKRLERLFVKSVYRKFMGECRTLLLNKIKAGNKPLWKYQKLFSKSKPTQEQEMFKQFLDHCAAKVQSTYKGYLQRLRYTTTKRVFDNLTRWVVGKKVRAVFSCFKIAEIRHRLAKLNKEIDVAFQKGQSTVALFKESNFAHNMFSQQFEFLYSTGGWIYEGSQMVIPVGIKVRKPTAVERSNKGKQRPPVEALKRPSLEDMLESPQQLPNLNPVSKQVASYSLEDQRPISSKGAYKMQELLQPQVLPQVKQEQAGPVVTQHKRLVRKEKYDPRKAIEQEKMRKKETVKSQTEQKKSQSNRMPQPPVQRVDQIVDKRVPSIQKVPMEVTKKSFKQGLGNKRRKQKLETEELADKSMDTLSELKKTRSRVDCWNKPPNDYRKKKSRDEAHFEQAKDLESYNLTDYKNIPRKDIHQNITRNLKNIIQKMQESKARRRKGLAIEDMEKVYQNQYLSRYKKLESKLEQLAVQRNQKPEGQIPYLTNKSRYSIVATSNVMGQEFFEMEQQIIINYREIVE